MGRVGAACDNAATESLFSLLQKNVLDTRRWETAKNSASRRHLDRNQVQPATTPTGPRQAPVEFEMITRPRRGLNTISPERRKPGADLIPRGLPLARLVMRRPDSGSRRPNDWVHPAKCAANLREPSHRRFGALLLRTRRSVQRRSTATTARSNAFGFIRRVRASVTRLPAATARSSGRRGRRFKSCHPDQRFPYVKGFPSHQPGRAP
jgi:hypothetical protein